MACVQIKSHSVCVCVRARARMCTAFKQKWDHIIAVDF
jgi:hypothetical protein